MYTTYYDHGWKVLKDGNRVPCWSAQRRLPATADSLIGFDEAGAGNGLSGTAPAFDPTCEGLGVKFPRVTRLWNFKNVLLLQKKTDIRIWL